MIDKKQLGIGVLALAMVGTLALLLGSEPLPQELSYHRFADQRQCLGISNCIDVLSNLPLLVVGLLGLWTFRPTKIASLHIVHTNALAYRLVFIGAALTGLGSGNYHLAPDNPTLVWDRIPIAITLMAIYCVVIGEFISNSLGRRLLLPLVLLGVASVLYWGWTEQQGAGDLRPYAAVQFFPVVTLPVLLLCFPSGKIGARPYWILLFSYLLAKLTEHFDYQIFGTLAVISGHSIKHILPPIGLYLLLRAYRASRAG